MSEHHPELTTREKWHRRFFDPHSREGHQFEILVTWMIILSVTTVTLETVNHLDERHATLFEGIEWVFTILFTLEFLLRLYTAPDRIKYVTSFFGLVDILSILPTYIGIFIPGKQSLLIIRILRLLRMFRIFKMGHFVNEGSVVISALRASKVKIVVFITFILICSVFMGALMYMIEQDVNRNIQNIPEGIYWAIVTLTTVGYGDAIPITPTGKMLATIVMIMGYGVIAVPTGIVTAEITNRVMAPRGRDLQICERCGHNDHLKNSRFCHHCGERMP
jgi:voltage-gated potassium channel